VANSRIWRDTDFEEVWVQPAAGDAGTALGAALQAAADAGDEPQPMSGADLGRCWSDGELAGVLRTAAVPFSTPIDLAGAVAGVLADNGIVAWFEGRSEFGPRALGFRSLLAHPGFPENLERLNDVKGREQFRPVAPMVLQHRAAEIFDHGPLPSPYMLFVHRVAPEWRDRIPAVVHIDGTARIQTVDPGRRPRLGATLRQFCHRTGLPVVINTSLNTAGRPMVDTPREALELFGSAPVDALVLGPHLVGAARCSPDDPVCGGHSDDRAFLIGNASHGAGRSGRPAAGRSGDRGRSPPRRGRTAAGSAVGEPRATSVPAPNPSLGRTWTGGGPKCGVAHRNRFVDRVSGR